MSFTKETVFRFEDLTKYDLVSYLEGIDELFTTHYPRFVSYYNGESVDLDSVSQDTLDYFLEESLLLSNIFLNINKDLLTIDFWFLVDYLSDVRSKIIVISRISKFLRSSKYEGFNESSLVQIYDVADYDTPEIIAAREGDDPQNNWTEIYTRNDISESDYRAEQGGYELRLGKRNIGNIFLSSVVDNLLGDNVYGKDFDFDFFYEDDDLAVLSPRETFKQAVKMLIGLKKTDIPEYPSLGVSSDLAIGNSWGSVVLPFIARQLVSTFGSDDTIVNASMKLAEKTEKGIFIEFEIESFYNYTIRVGL